MASRVRLEARIALGPSALVLPLALVLLTLMRTALGGGPDLWSVNWVENCEAFIPVAMGLLSVPLLLVDLEEGTWELNAVLPVSHVAGVRLLAVVGGAWVVTLAWLAVLALLWPPVPLPAGVLAALGPGLFLGGLGCLAGVASGRASLGYLLVIAVPVMDLVLQLLGGYQVLWPLQFINVFAYRWATPLPGWELVAAVMGAAGLVLYAAAIRQWRTFGTRHL